MRVKISRLIIACCVILGFAIVSYTYGKADTKDNKLRQQYEEGLKVAFDKNNNFCPEAMLPYLDSLLAGPDNSEKKNMILQFYKSTAFLKLGEEKKAIELLQSIVQRTVKQDKLGVDARTFLALAYLRLGERSNCIAGHSDGSCIFPIRGKGIYMDPGASKKGIELYEELLKGNPSDLESRWLLNIAYMTIGGYPDKVPAAWLIPGLDADTSSYKVNPFQDMAGSLKLNGFRNRAGGSIVDDFNNDGYLDIVTSTWGLEDGMHYFKNNGDGSFTDISDKSGLNKIKGGLNIIQADYNNDGYTDILVLRGAWQGEYGKQPNTLLKNNGDGTFTDVTIESGILSFNPTQTATWADFNNDGWLDLFIGNETMSEVFPHPSELFINNHDGTFTNVAAQAGCETTAFMKGVVSADYNNDGWPDIFISTLSGRKILLKNKGIRSKIPQFEDVSQAAGLENDPAPTFPTWFWDYDNDGWPDIFVAGYPNGLSFAQFTAADALNIPLNNNSKMHLYRNNHDGTFSDVSRETGLDKAVFAMGANFGDIDNDGWLDMYLGTGDPNYKSLIPNRMFKNIGGKKFAEVTASARVGNLQKGHGVAFADLDNDGDQDIFIETGGAFKGDAYYNSLYMNPGQGNNNWICLSLEGVQANRSAIGARISVSFTEDGVKRTVYRDVNSGGSFGASPLRREIGIGKAKMIDELTIKWPGSGRVQVFKNLSPCRFLRIKEGVDEPQVINLKTLRFVPTSEPMNMNGMNMSAMGGMPAK